MSQFAFYALQNRSLIAPVGLAQMKCLGTTKPLIVTDTGCCSEHNLAQYAPKNMKFLIIMDACSIWIRKEIEKLTENIKQMSAICPFDNTISGAGTSVMQTFEMQRQRTRGGKSQVMLKALHGTYMYTCFNLQNAGSSVNLISRRTFLN